MKNVMISALAALTLASTTTAFAGDTSNDYRPSAGEFADYAHGYTLSTGDNVHFTRQGKQRFFAQLDGQKRERMYAKSRGVFVTQSGARVEFSEQGDAVRIDNFEAMSPALAQQGLKDVTLASR